MTKNKKKRTKQVPTLNLDKITQDFEEQRLTD